MEPEEQLVEPSKTTVEPSFVEVFSAPNEQVEYSTAAPNKFKTESGVSELNRFDVHRKVASKLLGSASSSLVASSALTTSAVSETASETDLDIASLRIVSPTILPFSTTQAIVQIAAGLHHSVLLTDVGEVFTFGKFLVKL